MNGPAEILVLADATRATQDLDDCLRAAGHALFAVAHSAHEAMQTVAPGAPGHAEQLRPELVLIDIDLVRAPAGQEAVGALLRMLDVPAVYLAEHAQCLAQGAQAGVNHGPDERITAPLEPVALSLAIQLAFYRQGYERLRAQQSSAEPPRPEPPVAHDELELAAHRRAEEALRASEARYRAIVQDQTEFICRFVPDGTLTFLNDACARFVGKAPEELVGTSFLPFVHPEDRERTARAFALATPDDPVFAHEQRVGVPGGEIRWQSWTNRAIFDDAGELIEFQGVGRDITERRLAEEALRRSEARYALIFQMSAVPLWEADVTEMARAIEELRAGGVTDLRRYLEDDPENLMSLIALTNIVEINAEGLKLFGAESREQLTQAVEEIFIPESLPSSREVVIAQAEGREHLECENTYGTLQGERITVLLRVSFPSRERGLETMLLSAVDITERKRSEDKIKQLNTDLRRRAAELQAANTELESFSYSVSHDLRAPLRAIDGFSTAVLDEYGEHLDAQGKGYLARVCQASQRMSQLIDDLLDLSRMTRSSMQRETCNMSALAHSVVRTLRNRQPEREVEVTIEPDMRVHADPALLRVAVANLLGNAWKFTSKQPHAHIHMGMTRRDGRRAFFVRDDGAGFDMAYVDKLFGAFQRLHGVHEFAGTGIGLATVKRIIRRHGGDIWAEGKVGEGATFTFTLP